jgi:hypothetical protein
MTTATRNTALVFTGPGIDAYRHRVIESALQLLALGIRPGRAWTLTRTLAAASRLTGRTYPRSRQGAITARVDLMLARQEAAR